MIYAIAFIGWLCLGVFAIGVWIALSADLKSDKYRFAVPFVAIGAVIGWPIALILVRNYERAERIARKLTS
jgi:hypothetical protein